MQDIIIDEEFRALLPALDAETFARLEENIMENGCLFPLVLWENTLIDGFNRHKICTKHGIPFKTVSKNFDNRESVIIWIIAHQVARRNLTPLQLSYYRGLHYKADKKLVTNAAGKNQFNDEVESQSGTQPKSLSTARRLATQYNVSRNTILRDSQVAEAIDVLGETSPDAKRNVLSGAAGITKKQLKELLSGTEEAIMDIAAKIEDGSLERRKVTVPAADADKDPEERFDTDLSPFEAAIKRLTDAFLSDIRALSGSATAAEQRLVIKSLIANLESLLGQL